jgi:hypothetical protein
MRALRLLIINSFAPLKNVFWHISGAQDHAESIARKARAFVGQPGLSKRCISQTTFLFESGVEIFADTVTVLENSTNGFARLLSRSTSGVDTAFAFIPNDPKCIDSWSKAVIVLCQLYFFRDTILSSPGMVDADALLLSYAKLTRSLGGIPVIIGRMNERPVLMFFGDRPIIEEACTRLSVAIEPLRRADFEKWFQAGLHLPACP